MKTVKIFRALALISLVVLISCKGKVTDSQKVTNDEKQVTEKAASKGKYALKSGMIVYKTNVMGMEQKQDVTFDDYGNKEKTVIEMEMMGIKVSNYTVTKDGYMYSFDNEKKTGTKTPVITKSDAIEYQNLTKEYMDKMSIKKEGTEEMLGKTCEKYSIDSKEFKMKGHFWVWKGIAVKTDMEMAGMKMMMVAEKIEENPTIPDSTFDIPADITFQ